MRRRSSQRVLRRGARFLGLVALLAPLWAAAAPEPDIILEVPAEGLIGQNFSFTVSFDNTSGTATDVGFGPFIDVILPKNGADGLAGGGPKDGISFLSANSFGAPVDILVQEFPAPGGSITHPLTGETISGTPGDELVVMLMPFGSFTPTQPLAPVTVNVALSDHADLDFALPISARAGFQFGDTALGSNGPITQDPANFPGSGIFTPKLLIVEKAIGGGATGPNYVYQGVITVDAAPGQVLSSVVVEDFLPKEMQYQGIVSIAESTGTCSPVVEPPTDAPQNNPDSLLQINCTELTGGNPIVVTYSYFYPEFDADGAPILNPEFGVNPKTGECGGVANTADGGGLWDTKDPRDDDQTTSKTSDVALAETCHHVISKAVEILVDNGAPGLSDTDILEYTYSYEVSDYFTLGGPPQPGSAAPDIVSTLFIEDTLSDGQVYNWNFSPTYEINNRGETNSGAFTAGQLLEPSITNLGVDETGQPQSILFPGSCGTGETLLTFDLSQQLIDDGATGGVLQIVGGLVDLDGNGTADDTGVFGGIDIIDGYVDVDGEGDVPDSGNTLDPANDSDSAEIAANTIPLIDGFLDVNLDGIVDGADDSYFFGVQVVAGVLNTPDGVVGGFDIVSGGVDFNGSGAIDPADDGAINVFYDTIASQVDMDDDGAITASDNGFLFGIPVLAGFVDVALPAGIDTADDGAIAGFNIINGEIDINNDGIIDTADDGFIFDIPVIDGRVDVNGDGIPDDSGSAGPAGSLTGGCVVSGSQSPNPGAPGAWDDYTLFPCNPDTPNLQPPATGSFAYQAVMLDEYSCAAGDRSIDQGDGISNIVEVNTDILENREPRIITGPAGENPDSPPPYEAGTGLEVPVGEIFKEVYAINGDPNDPSLAVDYAGGNRVQYAPGDTVTYRIRYALPSSDVENFRFVDYLPLPSLQVADPDADNSTGPGWTFLDLPSGGTINASNQVVCNTTPGVTPPVAGQVTFGPGDTFHCHPGTPSIPADSIDPATPPSIALDDIGNTLSLTYGSFDNQENASSVMELLFTVTVQDDFFADGLFLTNQVRAIEENSTGDETIQDAIVQIQLSRPEVNIKKGIVDTDHPSAEFTPTGEQGPVSFTDVGDTSCPRFTGAITSDGLDSAPIDSDLTGVDANALATKAILIENTGKGINGAFNVQFQDDLPTGLTQAPSPADFNLCITDGAGNVFYDAGGVTTGVRVVDSATGACTAGTPEEAIFDPNCAIELVDPAPDFPFPPAANPPAGALAPGQILSLPGGQVTFNPNITGANIAVITYDLEVLTDTSPAQELTNTAILSNYAFITGGEDLTPEDLTDPATIIVGDPDIAKSIIATSEGHTTTPDVAIGETVTYEVVVDIPQGFQDGVVLTDTLTDGLVFESFDSIVVVEPAPGGSVTTSQGTFDDVLNNGSGLGTNQATFDFGRIDNSDTDVQVIEQIIITYTVRVTNNPLTDRGDPLDNAVVWSWNDGANTVATDADDLVVVEPELMITKDAEPTTGTAGDVITFTVTVEHVQPPSDTDAFDLIATDDILNNPDYTLVNDSVVAPGGTVVSDTDSVEVHYASVPLGNTVSFTFQATLNDSVQIGGTADNTASLDHYDSLPADGSPNERDYGPVTDDAIVTIDAPTIDKSIVSVTPDLGLIDNNAPVGSIITYQVTVSVPEGTSENVTLVDVLEPGLAFVDCIVVNPGDADITVPAGVDALCTDGTVATSNPQIETEAPSTTADQGRRITFQLGKVVVPGTTGGPTDIVFTYTAVVLDTLNNNHSGTRNNLATWSWDNDSGTQTINDAAEEVTIVEPLLSIDKALNPTTGDAGDITTVTLTINESQGAPAFETRIEDPLPANMIYQTATGFDFGSCVGAEPDAAQHDGSASGGLVSFDWAVFPASTTCVITFDVVISTEATPKEVIDNRATVNWTSLPDSMAADQSTYNDFSRERTSPTDPNADGEGASDDYTATDNATFTLIIPEIEKIVFATSEPSTDTTQFTGVADLTIGEEVTYEITVTLPEGTTDPVIISDTVPSSAAGVVEILSVGVPIDGIGTSLNPEISDGAPVISDQNLGDGLNDTVVFDFGEVVNTPDGVLNDADRIKVRIVAIVKDLGSNAGGDLLTNTARVDFGGTTQPSASADVDLVEPLLAIDKSAPVTSGDAGDVVNFTVRIEHTGNSSADAFDTVFTDAIPAGMNYNTGTLAVAAPAGETCPTPASTDDTDPSAAGLQVVFDTLPLGNICEITFVVTIDNAVTPGQEIPNNAGLVWDSLPADLAPDDPNERSGSASNDHPFMVTEPGMVKVVFDTSEDTTGSDQFGPDPDLTIGEQVTYQFTITFQEGTTENAVVTDQLPTGAAILSLVSSRVVAVGNSLYATPALPAVGTAGTPSDTDSDNYDDLVTWILGDVLNTPDGLDNTDDQLVFEVVALVVDDPTNLGDGTDVDLVNTATLTHGDPANPVEVADTALVDLVEPELLVTKSDADPAIADAGDVVTYTISVEHTGTSTADAFNLAFTDVLAMGTNWVGTVDAGTCTGLTTDATGDPTIVFSLGTLADDASCSFTYDVQMDNSVQPGTMLENTVTLGYYSQPVFVAGETRRKESVDTGEVTVPGPMLVKAVSDSSVSETGTLQHRIGVVDLAIGELVDFDLTVTFPEGVTQNAVITDTLPTSNGVIEAIGGSIVSTGALTTSNPGAPVLADLLLGDGLFDTVTFSFGTVTNAPDGVNDTNDRIVVRVTGRVVDLVPENADGDALTNNANFAFSGGDLTDSAEVDLVEPDLELAKTLGPVNGDLVTVTLQATNSPSATAPAYDFLLTDVFDESLWVPLSATDINVPAGLRLTQSSSGGETTVTIELDCVAPCASPSAAQIMLPGETLVFSFKMQLRDGAFADIENTADASVTSLPGTDHTDTNERGYAAQASDNLTFGSIGNFIWLDEDGDGLQDAGEDGIANVTVYLCPLPDSNPCDSTNPKAVSTITDANGGYLFDNLPAGDYRVSVEPPASMNPTFDEDGLGSLNQTIVSLGEGEEHLTADFGYNVPAGTIGDYVWIDADGDGIQDTEEIGLANVVITLRQLGPDGELGTPDDVIQTTTTDATGHYLFTDLPFGDYFVQVTPPGGYIQTFDPDESEFTIDNMTRIGLPPGGINLTADFGYQPISGGSDIGDTIFIDVDGDGIQDSGEPGIGGVTVALKDNAGNVIATTTTDANGNYLFPGLPSGSYTVEVSDTNNILTGLLPISDPDGVLDQQSMVSVDGVNDNLDQDFGYAPQGHVPGEGLIGDTVFLDTGDGAGGLPNGQPDPGEGIEGVLVELLDSSGNVIATTTTNENGSYFFGGLDPSGSYTVRVDTSTLPNGGAGLTNSVDPDGNTASESIVDLGASGGVNLEQDFGYTADVPNMIKGTLWEDVNRDGTLEGDELDRFEGVTVVLLDDMGNIVATTQTDSSGEFQFTGLPDGTYTVDVTDTENQVLRGYSLMDGPNDGADNNSQLDPYSVSVSGGQTDSTADFGFALVNISTPITLGYFKAQAGVNPGDVVFEWQTVTEIGNLGFHLYARQGEGRGGGGWSVVNSELIPSQTGDSVETRQYNYSATGVAGDTFALGDVDVFGKETLHGPFPLGAARGLDRSRRATTDWKSIKDEQKAKRKARKAKRVQQQQQRLERQLDRQLDGEEQQMRSRMKRQNRDQAPAAGDEPHGLNVILGWNLLADPDLVVALN